MSSAGRASSPEQAPPHPSAVNLFGLSIADIRLDEATSEVVRRAQDGKHSRVYFVNAHCVNVAARDRTYRNALEAAELLFADGSGMRIAGRLAGIRLKDNVNGTDLFPLLCGAAAEAGVGVALLGARPGVAERCAAAVRARHPGLRIVWVHHGYLADVDESSLIRDLNQSGAGILLVAMGVPAQELWLDRNFTRLAPAVVLGVGALFDFYSGDVPRAPAGLRRLGLEWTYRLLKEPKRLFTRYVVGNPVFLLRAVRRRLAGQSALRNQPL